LFRPSLQGKSRGLRARLTGGYVLDVERVARFRAAARS
jgi:hypothetical protein